MYSQEIDTCIEIGLNLVYYEIKKMLKLSPLKVMPLGWHSGLGSFRPKMLVGSNSINMELGSAQMIYDSLNNMKLEPGSMN